MSDQQKKPHLSPSALEMYAKCGEQFRRRYIEHDIIPPGVAMLRGTGIHGGVELNMRQKIETHADLPVGDIIDAAVSKFDTELAGGYSLSPEEQSRGATVVIGETRDTVASLARLAGDEVCPDYQPVIVEQAVRIELPHLSHDVLGVIDLVDDKSRVIDLKSAAKSKSQADADGSTQLTVYSAMHQVLRNEPPAELRLEVLVNTKTPKRQTLVTHRDERDIAALAARLEAVTNGVGKGVFAPAPNGAWYCSGRWCGYWQSCRFVNAERTTFVDLKAE